MGDRIATTTPRRRSIQFDALEHKALLSGFGHGRFFGGYPTPVVSSNPVIAADQTKLQAVQTRLRTDLTAVAATLQFDQQAVQLAISTSTTVQAAQQKYNTDLTTYQATLKADWQAIAAATDATTINTTVATLRADYSTAATDLRADAQAIQDAIAADPDVQAAIAKLNTDSATFKADQATIEANRVKLQADIQAQFSTTSSTANGTSTNRSFGFRRWLY